MTFFFILQIPLKVHQIYSDGYLREGSFLFYVEDFGLQKFSCIHEPCKNTIVLFIKNRAKVIIFGSALFFSFSFTKPVLLVHARICFFLHNIMCSAFDNACRRNKSQLRFLLELANRECSAVAHRGLNLAERQCNIVFQ